MKPRLLLVLLAIIIGVAASGRAPSAWADQRARSQPADSLNINIGGLLFRTISVNYMHLFGQRHGFLVEAGIQSIRNDYAHNDAFGVALGYRWHWRGRQNSGFVGVTLTHYAGQGEYGGENIPTTTSMITANVGRRWLLGKRLNITTRAGVGLISHDAHSDFGMGPAEYEIEFLLDNRIPFGYEAELSLGLVF